MVLSNDVRFGRYGLPEPTRTAASTQRLLAQDFSVVAHIGDTESFFVVGHGGTSIVQVGTTNPAFIPLTRATGSHLPQVNQPPVPYLRRTVRVPRGQHA